MQPHKYISIEVMNIDLSLYSVFQYFSWVLQLLIQQLTKLTLQVLTQHFKPCIEN